MQSHIETPQEEIKRKPPGVYEQYLQLGILLHLQTPDQEQVHPDELIFQIVHQTFEMWWKVTFQLWERAIDQLNSDHLGEAARTIRRSSDTQSLLVQVLAQLEGLAPKDFLLIRNLLNNASGAESPGFRMILRKAPALWEAFAQSIKNEHISLLDIYKNPELHSQYYDCAEALVDFDEQLFVFRASHFKLAHRYLGHDTTGTGGVPIPMLKHTLSHELFPELWQVRHHLLQYVEGQSKA